MPTTSLFEEVAKFRAARRIWAKLMKERFGAKSPRSLDAALPHPDGGLHADRPAAREQRRPGHAAGAGRGARRHAVAPHQLHATRRSPCPTEESVRIALRTQQVIAHESGVADTVDPLGGSYFVESLTDDREPRS